MAAKGAGVANRRLVAGATAGNKVLGVVPKWHVSQTIDVGKWVLGPTVPAVAGIEMTFNVPWNGPEVVRWQLEQPEVTPLWLYLLPANVGAVLVVRLVSVSTWQASQPNEPMAMWLLAGVLRAGVMAPNKAALVVLWHCAQLAVDEGAKAWILAYDGMTAKSGLVWQSPHCAVDFTGMWFDGMVGGPKPVKLVWQLPQVSDVV
jgi:DNA polymerase III psi subunit